MHRKWLLLASVILTAACSQAEDSKWLLGNWAGQRTKLAEKGIDFEFVLTLEGIANTSGGNTTGWRGLTNLDLIMNANGKAFGLSDDNDLHVYLLGNYGADPTEMIGDLQTSSNIEAPDTFKLYELWWRRYFWDSKASVLVGMHDYNSVFNSLDTAGLFTNSSFGISPDISQVPPSIFPTTSMAALLSFYPGETGYVHLGAYDGVPGDPGNERGTQLIINNDDGVFYAAEAGVHNEETGAKLGIGVWYRTTDFETEFDGKDYDNNSGYYIIGETRLTDKLAGFIQLGSADKNRNQVDHYAGAGINYSGLLAPDDVFGVAVAYARAGEAWGDSDRDADNYEMALEFTYEFHPTDWLTMQPGLQIIKNPDMNSELDDAVALGTRAYISF